jgi:sialic acid synthase SpsE
MQIMMQINGRDIGPGYQPYIVAEISGEHKGDGNRALDLIDAAQKAGADAAKLQLFDPIRLAEARGGSHKMLIDGLWGGRTLLSLYRETCTPREWFPGLFEFAKRRGITLFSSVFDLEGVDYLETLGCPAYKISSFEVTNLPLIRKAAATGKPVIISTGMAASHEIWSANDVILDANNPDYAFLHCISAYPCPIADANLRRMLRLPNADRGVIGLSDHTLGTTAAIVAVALGASIIEKHITLDRNNGGPDAAFSLEPTEFTQLVQGVRDAYASLGTGERPQSESIYRDLRYGSSQ